MSKNNLPAWYKGKKNYCGRCGRPYTQKEMGRQDGIWVCKKCWLIKYRDKTRGK